MISQFAIKDFRLFEDIEITNLSRVNLIVGKNSAGKSALLEAFLLYFSRMSLDVLVDLLDARQEYWGADRNKFSTGLTSNPVRHLFKAHQVPELSEDGFKLSSDKDSIHVKTAGYILDKSETGAVRRLITPDEFDNYDADFLDQWLILQNHSISTRLFNLNADMSILRQKSLTPKKPTIFCQFVPTNGISDTAASLLWDQISLTDLEKEVLNGIKLIEPMATGIAFVEASTNTRIPLVKIVNMNEPIPLKSLGDGMSRIFQIILSLVCAKDGVLIIDEFENGLHWSIQSEVWAIVFELSKKLNVQVFCSTHSRDCINSFQQVWGANEAAGSFNRVVKTDGHASIQAYDLELLSDSVETDVEVR